MPKPSTYKLKHYIKALEICVEEYGYGYLAHSSGRGSVYSFELFQDKNSPKPDVVWSVHYSHDRKQEVAFSNIRKAWEKTIIPQSRFMDVLNDVSGKKEKGKKKKV